MNRSSTDHGRKENKSQKSTAVEHPATMMILFIRSDSRSVSVGINNILMSLKWWNDHTVSVSGLSSSIRLLFCLFYLLPCYITYIISIKQFRISSEALDRLSTNGLTPFDYQCSEVCLKRTPPIFLESQANTQYNSFYKSGIIISTVRIS